jgi:hypothetical protein
MTALSKSIWTAALLTLLEAFLSSSFTLRTTSTTTHAFERQKIPTKLPFLTSLKASTPPSLSSSLTLEDWKLGGKVSVKVEQIIPLHGGGSSASTSVPLQVKDAWMKHHWEKGGGLPIFVTIPKTSTIESSAPLKRVIVPVMMEETLAMTMPTSENDDDDDDEGVMPLDSPISSTLKYTVTKPGPFFQADLVPSSHIGTVTFYPSSSNNTECRMTWEVEFETKRFRRLYQSFTDFAVRTAARTVSEAIQTPRILTLQTTLRVNTNDNPWIEARKEWLEFFWAKGGGLPLPPVISYGQILPEGGGTARTSILRIPPFLIDTIVDISTDEEYTEVTYQIENPGWSTFPFLIHTHLGRVKFYPATDRQSEQGNVHMQWYIEIRPFNDFVAPVVEKLLEMTASTIMRNLRVHLAEPDAVVKIKAPRGQAITKDLETFGSVSKETWIGGVLDAHLSDRRSTIEQTISILQPWTWGRSGNGRCEDYVQFEWTSGKISKS